MVAARERASQPVRAAPGRAGGRRDAGGAGRRRRARGRSSRSAAAAAWPGSGCCAGMRTDGVLTALDGDPEQLRAARKAFAEAGIAAGRTRLIFGTPAEVLPRLSPGAYDLVVLRRPAAGVLRPPRRPAGPGAGRRHARLPRPARGRPDRRPHGARSADGRPGARSPAPSASDETLLSAVLPIGAGLLVATKRH